MQKNNSIANMVNNWRKYTGTLAFLTGIYELDMIIFKVTLVMVFSNW